MRIAELKCPYCGADLQIEEDRKDCFCEYCGGHLFFDDETGDRTIKNITIIRDEARIKEAEYQSEKLKRESDIELKKVELKEKGLELLQNHKNYRETIKAVTILALILWIFLNGLLGGGILRIIPDFLFAVVLGLGIYLLATKNKQEDSGKKGKRK